MSAPTVLRLTPPPPNPWAYPDATLVLPADAPREDWLEVRRQGIGGSDASTIADLNPWSSRYALWLDKTGQAREKPTTAAMEWGQRLEPALRTYFTDMSGLEVRRCGLLRSKARPWQQYTPDGLVGDGGLLELKTTTWRSEDADIWRDGDCPDHAELQVQHGMAVTGRSHAWICGLMDGREPFIVRVERSDRLIAALTDMESEFWHRHVLGMAQPPIDDSEATNDALRLRWPLHRDGKRAAVDTAFCAYLEEYNAAAEAEKDAKARKQAAYNQAIAAARDAEVLQLHGEEVANLRANGTFSESKFREAYPDLAEEYTELRELPVLDRARLMADHPDIYAAHRARVLRPQGAYKPTRRKRATPTVRSA